MHHTRKNYLSFKFMMIIRLLFGQYFELSNSSIICLVARCYCIGIFVIICSGFRTVDVPPWVNYFYKFTVSESVIYLVLSFISKEIHVTTFYTSLYELQFYLFRYPRYNWPIYCAILIIAVICCVFSIAACVDITTCLIYFYVYHSVLVARLTIIYISDQYRIIINSLKKSLLAKFQKKNLPEEIKIIYIRELTKAYLNLSKHLYLATKMTRIRTTVAYTFDYLRMVCVVYAMITRALSSRIVLIAGQVLVPMSAIFLIPVLMEFANNDLDEVKCFLATQLLTYKEKQLQIAIYDAIENIEASSLRFSLWNGFPVNIDLALGFINVSISYVIVLLQFTY